MAYRSGNREWLDSTRGQVAGLLRRGPATVEELAAALGISDNAIRAHLQTLTRDGLVRTSGVRRGEGAGKPATVYEITAAAEPLFSQAYLPVLEALLAAVDHLSPTTRNTVIREAARELAAHVATGDRSSSPTDRAIRALEALGGLVEVTAGPRGPVIEGKGCPVSLVAASHPDVCRLVRQLLAEVTGREVREECDRAERARCRFVLER